MEPLLHNVGLRKPINPHIQWVLLKSPQINDKGEIYHDLPQRGPLEPGEINLFRKGPCETPWRLCHAVPMEMVAMAHW